MDGHVNMGGSECEGSGSGWLGGERVVWAGGFLEVPTRGGPGDRTRNNEGL